MGISKPQSLVAAIQIIATTWIRKMKVKNFSNVINLMRISIFVKPKISPWIFKENLGIINQLNVVMDPILSQSNVIHKVYRTRLLGLFMNKEVV